MSALLADLRALGLPMGNVSAAVPFTERDEETDTERTGTAQTFVSWTTDQAKIDAAREKGATIREYRSTDERFSGAEVIARVVQWD